MNSSAWGELLYTFLLLFVIASGEGDLITDLFQLLLQYVESFRRFRSEGGFVIIQIVLFAFFLWRQIGHDNIGAASIPCSRPSGVRVASAVVAGISADGCIRRKMDNKRSVRSTVPLGDWAKGVSR